MVENESIRKPIQTLRKTDAITRLHLIKKINEEKIW